MYNNNTNPNKRKYITMAEVWSWKDHKDSRYLQGNGSLNTVCDNKNFGRCDDMRAIFYPLHFYTPLTS